jgi:hypothetical protein
MSLNYYILLAIPILALITILIYSFIGEPSKKKAFIAIVTTTVSCGLFLLLNIGLKPKLEANARYKPDGKLEVKWNQADSEFYINYLGRPIKLRDACSEQFGTYIDNSKIEKDPYVNVFEKTYIPVWGLTLSNTPEVHFVHGADVRIDQNIEIE